MKNAPRFSGSARRFVVDVRFACMLILAIAVSACTHVPEISPAPITPGHAAIVGWRNCTNDDCGRDFFSAYSTFLFVNVDGERPKSSAMVTLPPGRHWIEAHYSWGAGLIIGTGNYRNYGFELDMQPDHRYLIESVPQGCIVPLSRYWVSYKTLRVIERSPAGKERDLVVRALEYCTPTSAEPGTCTKNSQCRAGTCLPFKGTTGFGMCGELRD